MFQNGAKVIYETDDDNFPDFFDVFDLDKSDLQGLHINTSDTTYNILAHFGQSSVWPRGFPLGSIAGASVAREYALCKPTRPPIQQGAVIGDPDVDAIFRLSRKSSQKDLYLQFDKHAPVVRLPPGTFSPYNSQNTMFMYEAFWSLSLPAEKTMRTCDIYRSYIAQRLLWLIGETIAFYPPTAISYRNAHSYVDDFKDEQEMYLNMDRMVQFLHDWECSKSTFRECIHKMYRDLIGSKFLTETEKDFQSAWINDLVSLGYIFPDIRPITSLTFCRRPDSPSVTYFPEEKNTSSFYIPETFRPGSTMLVTQTRRDFREKICHRESSVNNPTLGKHLNSDIMLVVRLTGNAIKDVIVLESAYRDQFPLIIYCGGIVLNDKDKELVHKMRVSYVKVEGHPSVLNCMHVISELRLNVLGFLILPDTTMPSKEFTQTFHDPVYTLATIKLMTHCPSGYNCEQFTCPKSLIDNTIFRNCTVSLDSHYYFSETVVYMSSDLLVKMLMMGPLQKLHLPDAAFLHIYACAQNIYTHSFYYSNSTVLQSKTMDRFLHPLKLTNVLVEGTFELKLFCDYTRNVIS